MKMSDQQQGSDWSELWKVMTTPNEKWFGPNTQVGLGQMAKAMNPSGVTGNVGEMFSNYVQGVQAQEATAQQMKQQQELMQYIYKALGLAPDNKFPVPGQAMDSMISGLGNPIMDDSSHWLKRR
jgi:hypothetical protein